MSILDVPGARLHYETRGAGPLLLMVPGAPGNGRVFADVAGYLAPRRTVVTYDRRGFSRSTLVGAQDYDHRLRTDAADVRRLIEHLDGDPAIVFGASSGAVVALEVLARDPGVVRTLVAFEPAAVGLLPDGQQWLAFFHDLYRQYRRSGPEPALEAFRARTFPPADRQVMTPTTQSTVGEHVHANATYWFERELRQYPAAELDLYALAARARDVVPMAGHQSRGFPTRDVALELGRRLGRGVVETPGGHTGYVSHPAEFARVLIQVTASG